MFQTSRQVISPDEFENLAADVTILRDDSATNFTELILAVNTVEDTQRKIESSVSTINSQLVGQK